MLRPYECRLGIGRRGGKRRMADGTAKRMMPQRQPERIVSGQALDEDARLDVSVRPKRLDEYIGQKRVKENIQIAIDAARSRDEALDHVLLYGPPGLGKTTLAQIIANELNVPIKTSAGPLLERKGDLSAVLTSLEKKEVFFLDEIHRLQPAVEEVLYPAMEDFRVDLIIGQGPGARIHPFQLGHFTLIGATTRAGLITAPLRSRFGIVHRLDFYEPADLLIIIHRSAKILNIQMDEGGAEEIAGRCRGTPRIANRGSSEQIGVLLATLTHGLAYALRVVFFRARAYLRAIMPFEKVLFSRRVNSRWGKPLGKSGRPSPIRTGTIPI